ncbi:ngoBIM [Symbiodinium sp. CCMP2592]|nr:ngoBIM [Symbiodinium sp. CCMP2592]
MADNHYDHLLDNWSRLRKISEHLSPLLTGSTVNILAIPFDEPVFQQERVLVRAYVASAQGAAPEGQATTKVVLLLRAGDWTAVSTCSGPLRILQATLGCEDQQLVLDCTGIQSVVVATCMLRNDTSLEVAEIFSGGFAGWTQAIYVLHQQGLPISTAWTLDIDPDCSDMLRYHHASWSEVHNLEGLREVPQDATMHLCTDINANWWLRVFQDRPVSVACVSAPCQPWSSAGSEQGLLSEDGRLLLRAADILGTFQVPFVLLEQVANFPLHPHFRTVMKAWDQAGYRIQWQASLNLLDVLPGQRVRFFIVFQHASHTTTKCLEMGAWTTSKRMNLGQAKVLFPLPPSLRSACTPSTDVLAEYMDPYYVPSPRQAHLRPQSPAQYRLRTAHDVAGVFVAQYQYQHELPPLQKQKGILGCLLQQAGCTRFFSGPEIAAIHGATLPTFLHSDRRTQMRLLGNAVAVPQAVVPLIQACCRWGVADTPEPAEAVSWCLQSRLHSQNSVLMPFGEDWVLCHHSQTEQVLQAHAAHSPLTLHAEAPDAFVPIACQVGSATFRVLAPTDVDLRSLLSFVGCTTSTVTQGATTGLTAPDETIRLRSPPELNCNGVIGSTGPQSGFSLILTETELVVTELHTPRSWSQLLNVFQQLAPGQADLALFSTTGQRLHRTAEFQTCMIAVAEDPEVPIFPLSTLVPCLHGLQLRRQDATLQLEVEAGVAAHMWLAMPFHLLYALGWSSEELDFPPPRDSTATFVMRPSRLVEVQVVARKLWEGVLPGGIALQLFSDIWNGISRLCSLPSGHRIFSGPHPHDPATTLQTLHQAPRTCVIRRTGHLVITIHPEIRGGGVKSENLSWAQTRAASECLSQGLDLGKTTAFVDKLSNAVGAQRLSQTLQDTSSGSKWAALTELAASANVAVPLLSNLPAKAAARATKQQQRRKAQDRRTVTAAEVQLTTDFFLNEDGSCTSVLDAIQPGVSGIKLVDEPEAAALLQALRGVQPDELGLLVLGHSCPNPAECNGHMCFPATSKETGARLLLAGCLHNVGGRRNKVRESNDIQVSLPELNCCSFECYADEFEDATWQNLVQAPVRAVLDKDGLAKPFSDPWGRSFSQAGRPALATLADRLYFQARVPTDQLDKLLVLSGHNHVYVTPRKMDRTIVQAYSIVWLGASRADALHASLQVPGQLGIARAKAKFGLRIPAARFTDVFAQLRPGQIIPNKVAVSQLYRIGPLPQEVGNEALVEWATQAGWQIRVIKSLGARHWLIGAAAPPPTIYPAFNGQTILISAVGDRHSEPPVVQSGSLPQRSSPLPAKETQRKGEDPWLINDPWSRAVSNSIAGGSFSSRASMASTETPARNLAGPTEQRFKAQDSRLLALETGLENLRLKQEAQHGELLQRQAEDRETSAKASLQLRDQMCMMSNEFAAQLKQSVESLRGAQQQQQQQTLASFEELKCLMMSCCDTRDSSKKAKTGQEEELTLGVSSVCQLALSDNRRVARCSFIVFEFLASTDLLHHDCPQPTTTSILDTGLVRPPTQAPVQLLRKALRERGDATPPSTEPEHQAAPPSDDTTFRLSVVNPTSILHKEAALLQLRCHVYLLSETSAVEEAQTIVSQRLRAARLTWVWGKPVAPHYREGASQPSLRGHAAGVALASVFPARAPFQAMHGPAFDSQRLVVGHVRLGPLHARVVVVYGWPANHSAAAARNQQLFQEVLALIQESDLPTLVGGDFNTDVTCLPVWEDFVKLGFAELFHLYNQRFQQELPATCRGSTCHDTLLLPPLFQQLLQQATVSTDCHLFDSHAPVVLHFALPQSNPCHQVWRKPASWSHLQPEPATVERFYCQGRAPLQDRMANCSSREDLEALFLDWAEKIEDSVDLAVQQQHFRDPLRHPTSRLPRSARGRCSFRDVKLQPSQVACPAARPGDYQPPDEPISFRSRHKVKQVRRLQAFGRHLARVRRLAPTDPNMHAQVALLHKEWLAVLSARGYPPDFPSWILQVAHFEAFYGLPGSACASQAPSIELVSSGDASSLATALQLFPPSAWLDDVLSYVRYECEAVICQEHDARRKVGQYRQKLDSASGLKAGYRSVRPAAKPPFTVVPVHEQQHAVLHCCAADGEFPVEIGHVQDDEIFGPRLWLRIPDAPYQHEFPLSQHTDATTPRELSRCFIEFWNPIWNRDKGQARQDLDAWTDFLQSLPAPPEGAEKLHLPLDSVAFWRRRLQLLKPHSATGYCGFSNLELKNLPESPLEDLVQLFALCHRFGWPSHLASATVSVLAKVATPQGMRHGRPITVFANVYRLWASGVATAILQSWSDWLPPGLKGCIPGRSVRDLSLALECQIEQCLLDHQAFAGFSIDIVKCFNQLPRLPLRYLLGHLQVPEYILSTWFDFLDSCQRRPVAVCWAAHSRLLVFGAQLSSYVDNFTWTGHSQDAIAEAIVDAQDFCRSLRLPIDWDKSFAWATTRTLRRWLSGTAQNLVPQGATLRIVDTAKDLGVAFKFRRTNALATAQKNIAEGKRRLQQLQRRSLPLFDAARIIQTSVWPTAFYALEGRLLAEDCTAQLRTEASRALIGQRASASPLLALSALTARVTDPEVYLLCQALLALQRLLVVDPALARQWLRCTVQHFELPHRAIGPATALAGRLRRNGWRISTEGIASGPGHIKFDLRHDRPKTIRAAVRAAWLHQLPEKLQDRNGMRFAGVPVPEITDRVLSRFNHGLQVHLAQTIVGAYMSNAARSQWDPLQAPTCSLCGGLDHKAHRILDCPATVELRALYAPLLNWVLAEQPHWIHCPFPVASPQEPFLRLYWRSRRLRPPPHPQHLQQSLPEHCHFYTDGACTRPNIPAARHAAWAVVLYVGSEGRTLHEDVDFWQRHSVTPPGWHIVAQGVVPGQQDINRAEYCAISQALQLQQCLDPTAATVWSDSNNALRAVQQPSGSSVLPSKRHFAEDLVPDDLDRLRQGTQLCKVQAHQSLHDLDVNDETAAARAALGNAIADEAAKAALRADLPISEETCASVASWLHEQEDKFGLYCRYLEQLTKLVVPAKRQAAATLLEDPPPEGSTEPGPRWIALQPPADRCTVTGPALPAPQFVPGDWPPWYVKAVSNWVGALLWPPQLLNSHRHSGITYLELLVNFVVCTGQLPPVRTTESTGPAWVNLCEPAGVLLPVIVRELTVQFVNSINSMSKRLELGLWPSPRHHRLHSLDFYGSCDGRKGLLYRPHLEKLNETQEALSRLLLADNPGETLRELAWHADV